MDSSFVTLSRTLLFYFFGFARILAFGHDKDDSIMILKDRKENPEKKKANRALDKLA